MSKCADIDLRKHCNHESKIQLPVNTLKKIFFDGEHPILLIWNNSDHPHKLLSINLSKIPPTSCLSLVHRCPLHHRLPAHTETTVHIYMAVRNCKRNFNCKTTYPILFIKRAYLVVILRNIQSKWHLVTKLAPVPC